MALQQVKVDVAVPEAESFSNHSTASETEESLNGSSNSNDNKDDDEVKAMTTAAATATVEKALTAKKKTTKKSRNKYRPRIKDAKHKYPVEPRVIHLVHRPKTYVDHSYRDFSCVPPEEGYKECGSIEEMTFAQKVHHMLSQPQYNYMIAWVPAHGRAWRVLRPSDFERNVMPNYFGHSRYSNFLSMIRQNGFKCLTLGPDKGCLYHEFMLRGLPHLASYMPVARTPRRLTEDPDNEPDFYSIAKLYPLPDRPIKAVEAGAAVETAVPATSTTPFMYGTAMAPAHQLGMTQYPQAMSHTVTTIGGQTYVIPSMKPNMQMTMTTQTPAPAGTTMLMSGPSGNTTQFFLTGGAGGLPTFSFPPQLMMQQPQQPQPGCATAATASFLPMVAAASTMAPALVSQPAATAAPADQDEHDL